MKRVVALSMAIGMSIAGLAAPARSASASVDWILLTFNTPISDDPPKLISLNAKGRFTGPAPLLVGHAESSGEGRSRTAQQWMYRVGNGDRSVEVNTPGGRITRRVTDGGRSFEVSEGWYRSRDARAMLVYFAGGTVTRFTLSGPGMKGARVRTGNGSRVLTVSGEGVNATAGPAGAGTTTHVARPTKGIVGMFDTGCVDCTGGYSGPGGRKGTWAAAFVVAPTPFALCVCHIPVGDYQFSGPAGRWSWEWRGATLSMLYWYGLMDPEGASSSTPQFGAYAPIGEDWTLFTNFATILGDLDPTA